MIQFQRT